MKLIRLTDDRYIFDGGPDITMEQLDAINQWWKHWWEEGHDDVPRTMTIGGSRIPLEYEDRRESDIEGRLATIEEKVAQLIQDRKEMG